jgi:hypothetical protein
LIDFYHSFSELRSKADGSLLFKGYVDLVDPIAENSAVFLVDYRDASGELRSKADGSVVAGLNDVVVSIDPIGEDSAVFLVHYSDAADELRSKADGSLVAELSGRVESVDPIGEDSAVFLVGYSDAVDELRSKADGSRVAELNDVVVSTDSIDKDFAFFRLSYADTADQLRSKADGSLMTADVDQVWYDPNVSPDYCMVTRKDQHTELWQLEPLRRLVDLNIGLGLSVSSTLPLFDPGNNTLSVTYEDGRSYLLDLAWLAEAQNDGGAADGDLFDTACWPYAGRYFDPTILTKPEYLGDRPLKACVGD